MLYAGLDVHRDTIQAAVLDGDGKILTNQKIPHTPESVRDMAGRLPKQTRYVMESSSGPGGNVPPDDRRQKVGK